MPAIYYCDGGCGHRMTDEECTASLQVSVAFQKENLEVTNFLGWNMNLASIGRFCPACLPFAEDYWKEQVNISAKALKHYKATLENHAKSFFAERKKGKSLKLVEK